MRIPLLQSKTIQMGLQEQQDYRQQERRENQGDTMNQRGQRGASVGQRRVRIRRRHDTIMSIER